MHTFINLEGEDYIHVDILCQGFLATELKVRQVGVQPQNHFRQADVQEKT